MAVQVVLTLVAVRVAVKVASFSNHCSRGINEHQWTFNH